MVEALGYRIRRLFVSVFVAGSALAGLGGVMWAFYRQTLTAGMGMEVMVLVFIVIIIGGLGSVGGCFVGSLLVALVANYVGFLAPKLALVSNILVMALVLVWRPQGLFPVAADEHVTCPARCPRRDAARGFLARSCRRDRRARGCCRRSCSLILVGSLATPFLFSGSQPIGTAAKICVFIVLVASYDLLLGYTGIVSFAHTMFFGIGGYGVGDRARRARRRPGVRSRIGARRSARAVRACWRSPSACCRCGCAPSSSR